MRLNKTKRQHTTGFESGPERGTKIGFYVANIKYRILIVTCKGCGMDLDYKNSGSTGNGALPPFRPDEPFRVFMKSIEPAPGTLTCPECNQAYDYATADVEERSIAEPEIGDTVWATGENGRFKLLSLNGHMARIKLLGEGANGPVDLKYEVEVPYTVLTLFKRKH